MSQDSTRRSFVRTTAPLLAGCLGFGDSSSNEPEPADGANSTVPPNGSD